MAGARAAGRPVGAWGFSGAAAARCALADGAVALDVRESGEVAGGVIPGAITVPLGELQQRGLDVPRERPVIVYCGHGERAASAASILERGGFTAISNIRGGTGAWTEAGYPLETAAAPA